MFADPSFRRVINVLTGAALLLAALLIQPFWKALLVAAVLAAVLRPAMEWLAPRLRRRRHLAAILITTAVVLAVLIPLATLATLIVAETIQGVAWLRAALESQGMAGLLDRLPSSARPFAEQLLSELPKAQEELQALVGRGGQAAAYFGGVLAATGGAILQSVIGLILFYFLLVDGTRLVDWAEESLPLPAGQLRTMLLEFRRTASAVLVATLGTAGIQTGAAQRFGMLPLPTGVQVQQLRTRLGQQPLPSSRGSVGL